MATRAGKKLKLFVVFDTCREPLEIPLKTVEEYHKKQAEEAGLEYIPGDKVENKQNFCSPFNYYAIYGTNSGSTVKADS